MRWCSRVRLRSFTTILVWHDLLQFHNDRNHNNHVWWRRVRLIVQDVFVMLGSMPRHAKRVAELASRQGEEGGVRRTKQFLLCLSHKPPCPRRCGGRGDGGGGSAVHARASRCEQRPSAVPWWGAGMRAPFLGVTGSRSPPRPSSVNSLATRGTAGPTTPHPADTRRRLQPPAHSYSFQEASRG